MRAQSVQACSRLDAPERPADVAPHSLAIKQLLSYVLGDVYQGRGQDDPRMAAANPASEMH
jgi:hypothetical protein